mmetsp:Transcript_15328/g.25907  ORF Transcript_15328/g.25907 Transcript_15328/m.25907 type:complete len:99 (-) Transcript_15328:63-359(-)
MDQSSKPRNLSQCKNRNLNSSNHHTSLNQTHDFEDLESSQSQKKSSVTDKMSSPDKEERMYEMMASNPLSNNGEGEEKPGQDAKAASFTLAFDSQSIE